MTYLKVEYYCKFLKYYEWCSFVLATDVLSKLRKTQKLQGHGAMAMATSQAWKVPGRSKWCWWHALPQDQLQQILPRLLWESCYEALPLKEELAQLSTLVSEQTWVNVASNKTRTAPIIDLVWSGYYKVLGKGKLPKQPIMVKAKFFSRRAKEKFKGVEVGGLCPGSLKPHGGKFSKCSQVLKK